MNFNPDWTLLGCVAALTFLLGVRSTLLSRLKMMADAGVPIRVNGTPFVIASNILTLLANINLIVFLLFAGFRLGWGVALVTVLGGYAAALAITFLMRGQIYDSLLTFNDKLAWGLIPLLSVLMWLLLYKIIPNV